jgi:acyl-CoA hydrolase
MKTNFVKLHNQSNPKKHSDTHTSCALTYIHMDNNNNNTEMEKRQRKKEQVTRHTEKIENQ